MTHEEAIKRIYLEIDGEKEIFMQWNINFAEQAVFNLLLIIQGERCMKLLLFKVCLVAYFQIEFFSFLAHG